MKKKKYIIPGIILIILCLHFICEAYFFTPFAGIKLAIWNFEHRNTDKTEILIIGNSTIYEEDTERFEKYLNLEEMSFSWAEEEDDYMMILGENYSRRYYNHEEAIYSHGPMGFYNGAVIVMVNPKEEKIVKEIEISPTKGKVIYMTSTMYGLMKHEKVQFYEIATGELIKEEIIEDFVKNELYDVDVSSLNNGLKISKEGEIVYSTIVD